MIDKGDKLKKLKKNILKIKLSKYMLRVLDAMLINPNKI